MLGKNCRHRHRPGHEFNHPRRQPGGDNTVGLQTIATTTTMENDRRTQQKEEKGYEIDNSCILYFPVHVIIFFLKTLLTERRACFWGFFVMKKIYIASNKGRREKKQNTNNIMVLQE